MKREVNLKTNSVDNCGVVKNEIYQASDMFN